VILDDVKLIREALNSSSMAGRADTKVFNFYAGGKHGMYMCIQIKANGAYSRMTELQYRGNPNTDFFFMNS
jgi:hypothetical protein